MELDDTEDVRTVIVNRPGDMTDLQRFHSNLSWSITDLVSFLKKKLDHPLSEEYRLRSHADKRIFTQEEMDSKLSNYESFVEGGT